MASRPSRARTIARRPSSRSPGCWRKRDDIIPIPATTRLDHLDENVGALDVRLSADNDRALDALINAKTVSGPRYNDATFPEIDTERA